MMPSSLQIVRIFSSCSTHPRCRQLSAGFPLILRGSLSHRAGWDYWRGPRAGGWRARRPYSGQSSNPARGRLFEQRCHFLGARRLVRCVGCRMRFSGKSERQSGECKKQRERSRRVHPNTLKGRSTIVTRERGITSGDCGGSLGDGTPQRFKKRRSRLLQFRFQAHRAVAISAGPGF